METVVYVLDPEQYRVFLIFAGLVVALLGALLVSTWGN